MAITTSAVRVGRLFAGSPPALEDQELAERVVIIHGKQIVVGVTSFGDQLCESYGADTRIDIEPQFALGLRRRRRAIPAPHR